DDLLAAEGQQLPRERAGALRRLVDLERVRAPRIGRLERADEQVGVAADRGQEVVEVVRDPAGQAADRLHLLRLAQLLVSRAELGLDAAALDRGPEDSGRRAQAL